MPTMPLCALRSCRRQSQNGLSHCTQCQLHFCVCVYSCHYILTPDSLEQAERCEPNHMPACNRHSASVAAQSQTCISCARCGLQAPSKRCSGCQAVPYCVCGDIQNQIVAYWACRVSAASQLTGRFTRQYASSQSGTGRATPDGTPFDSKAIAILPQSTWTCLRA